MRSNATSSPGSGSASPGRRARSGTASALHTSARDLHRPHDGVLIAGSPIVSAMRFSVTYPLVAHPYNPELLSRNALERFCQVAEASGFDGVGFTDHPAPTAKWLHSGGHDALDPFVALAFCAASTNRIRLIPNIVVLPYRHPLIVAKMVATLDMLSEGRFTLAVATGYLRGEYRALGIDFEQRIIGKRRIVAAE